MDDGNNVLTEVLIEEVAKADENGDTQDDDPQDDDLKDDDYKGDDSEDYDSGDDDTPDDDTQEDDITHENDTQDQGEKNLKRKRSKRSDVNPNKWKRNLRVHNRTHGLSYNGVKKIQGKWNYNISKPAKKIRRPCDCASSISKKSIQCRCINEDHRQKLHEDFLKLDRESQKVFICSLVETHIPERSRDRKDEDDSRRNKWTVRNWKMQQLEANSSDVSPPKPEKRMRLTSDRIIKAKDWLSQLATMESHYCRSSSTKQYLEPLWSTKAELHRCYVSEMTKDGHGYVSNAAFSAEFDQLNLKLFRPKKDQCDVCDSYKKGNLAEDAYMVHRELANLCRAQKDQDKHDVDRYDKFFLVDLQSVLLAPRNNVSSMYYKTKLKVHNQTILNGRSLQAYCFVWHEANGGLTSDVFASILYSFLLEQCKAGERVALYSDGCTYQNRNSTLTNALSNLAEELQITLEHKYLEPGHTQMEVDSIHSTIEQKIRGRSTNVPADYVSLIETAKIRKPLYTVKYLDFNFFKNFQAVSNLDSIRPPKLPDMRTQPVVTEIRGMKYFPNGDIFYKLHPQGEYHNLKPDRPRRQKVVHRRFKPFSDLPPLYNSQLTIKKSKYDHLQDLKKSIPQDYHNFYDSLLFSSQTSRQSRSSDE